MLTPDVKPLTLAITKGPSLTSAPNYMRVNVLSQRSDYSVVAMCGRQDSSDSCQEVRLFMSLTFRPQKCKSLPTSLSQTFTHRRLRLDLGCGESTLTTHFFFLPATIPCRFRLLDSRMCKAMARELSLSSNRSRRSKLSRTASSSVSAYSIT